MLSSSSCAAASSLPLVQFDQRCLKGRRGQSCGCCVNLLANTKEINKLKLMPTLILILCVALVVVLCASQHAFVAAAARGSERRVISIKVGALLEESDHEQANMFIRIIKMINERRDETIRQLFNISNSNNDQNQQQQKQHDQQQQQRRKRNVNYEEKHAAAAGATDAAGSVACPSSTKADPLLLIISTNQQLEQQAKHKVSSGEQVNISSSSSSSGKRSAPASLKRATNELEADEERAQANNENQVEHQKQNDAADDDDDGDKHAVLVKLEPMIEFLNNRHSSFEADLKVCQLIESGVHSLIGPTEGVSIQHVQSICDNMELPYFELRPFLGSGAQSGAANLAPPTTTLFHLPQAQFVAQGAAAAASLPTTKNHSLAGTRKTRNQNANNNGAEDLSLFSADDDDDGDDATAATAAPDDVGINSDDDDVKVKSSLSQQQTTTGTNQMRTSTFTTSQHHHQEEKTLTSSQALAKTSKQAAIEADTSRQHQTSASLSASPELFNVNSHDDNDEADEDNDNNNNNNKTSTTNADLNSRLELSHADGSINPATTLHHHHNNHHQQQQQQLPLLPATNYNKLEDLTLNLYPPAYLLTSAYIDLIYAWNWTSFAIVYEEGNSMIKLQDLFKESSGTWTSKWQIKLFQFNPQKQDNTPTIFHSAEEFFDITSTAPSSANDSKVIGSALFSNAGFSSKSSNQSILSPGGGDDAVNQILSTTNPQNYKHQQKSTPDISNNVHRQPLRRKKATFRDIFWKIKSTGELNILLDVKTENLYEALKHAQQVGCMTEKYSYLITSLDLHTIDLEDFKYSRTRITALNILQVAKLEPVGNSYYNEPIKQATNESSNIQQQPYEETNQNKASINQQKPFDEKYLEKLGIHVIPQYGEQIESKLGYLKSTQVGNHPQPQDPKYLHLGQQHYQAKNRPAGYKLSPPVVLERTGSYMDPPSDAYKDWSKREMLLSSPASMSLLPHLDRDNEQRLFEFFVDQQERNFTRVRLSTSSAILHDSLLLFMLGLKELDPNGEFLQSFNGQQEQKLTCSLNSSPWLHGSSLVNYMRQISFTGLTGKISFDQRGFRSDFKLDVMGMAPDIGLIKIGEWHSKNALTSSSTKSNLNNQENSGVTNTHHTGEVVRNSKSYDEVSRFYDSELKRYNAMLAQGIKVQVPYTKIVPQRSNGALQVNEIIFERLYREQADQVETLIVTTKLSQPYFMLKETPNKLEGNDQYEGFAVDLIHELSKLVNFKYRWREVADKKYGSKEQLPNGSVVWNGMIGEIVRGQADLAIVDLTITAQREEAVDFTLPFMNTGISILFKKPTTKVTTLFSFLSPFSSDVWAYVLAAYCGISANLFFVGHLSPYEWADPHPCRHSTDDDSEIVLKNQFSLLNSFWFTIGSLMQQGSDLTPRSMSTRTIAGIWYFFTLIMISSYTANLAAFLTVEKVVYPIENVRDLSNQDEIKYGCVESGSTCTFFHDSQIETYKKINETMRKFKTYVRSNDEGQKRVEEGKFAFFMESASIEYIVERNCNLTQIGGLLDSKGYGLATSKRSRLKRPYRTLLSEGILHLQETGMLHILKNRWWKERRGGGTCTDDGKGSGVTELSLANVGGVFVVLLGGLGISFLVAIAEFMWRARRSGSTRDRMCEEMMSDLKFALACKSSTKPISHRRSNHHHQQQSQNAKRQSYASKQQLSVMSSTSQLALDPNNLNYQLLSANPALLDQITRAGKDCDPVLLHAMLTMVLQQQQQQQQHQHPQQEITGFMAQQHHIRPQRSYTLNSVHDNDNRLQRNNRALGHQVTDISNHVGGFSGEFSLDTTHRFQEQVSENLQSRRQQGSYHRSQAICDSDTAGKRRLLFANQQTIDDSLFGQDTLMSRHN